MSWLVQQLLRECKQSPGKATVLGVLLLVGLWVCWPQGEETPSPAAVAAPASPAVPASGAISEGRSSQPVPPWQQWLRQNQQQLWKQPPAEALQNPNAFAPLVQEVTQEQKLPSDSDTRQPPAETKPAVPQWRLSGVSLGRGRAVALIDGRAYLQGDKLRWKDQQFTLRQITREGVILENTQGQTLELKLPRPDEDPRIQLRHISARATAEETS